MKKNKGKVNFFIIVICLIFFFILILKCGNNGEKEEQSDNKNKQNTEITENNSDIEKNMSFSEFWEYNKASIPNYEEYEHLRNYSFKEICRFYRMLQIAYFNMNGSIDSRIDKIPEDLAEKNHVSKYVFLEVKSYFSTFDDYCEKFNKLYFSKNTSLLIKPNYYSSLTSTAYIGNFTFDCSFEFGKINKDEIKNKINEKISWLKNNLPAFYDGFRILKISYIDETTEAEKKYDYSYIYRKKDNLLKQMKFGSGTYKKELPEKENHWWLNSWNDMEELKQIY